MQISRASNVSAWDIIRCARADQPAEVPKIYILLDASFRFRIDAAEEALDSG